MKPGGIEGWDVLWCVMTFSSVITRSRVVCAISCSTVGGTTDKTADARSVSINPVRRIVFFLIRRFMCWRRC